MFLNWSAFKRMKYYNSIEETEAEHNPAKVRRLSLKGIDVESLRGRLRQFSRLESLEFRWCPNLKECYRPETDVTFSPELRAEILELQNLQSFAILNTPVREIPIWLSPLPKLKSLMVRGTGIQEIPADIVQFRHLRELRLGNNDLFSVPVEIAELRNLERLGLSDTFVSNIPIPILRLPRLRSLELAGTNFTPEGVAKIKAHFPHASVWAATSTRVPSPYFYLRRRVSEKFQWKTTRRNCRMKQRAN